MNSRKLLRSIASVSMFTMLSRILGLLRDRVIISAFDNDTKDAFTIAFKIPNMFRRLSAEGAFTAAFVPVLNDYLVAEDKTELDRFIHATLSAMSIFLIVVTTIGVVFGSLIVLAYVPGFALDKTKFDLTVIMLKMMFPYITLISLATFFMAILNSVGRFAVAALSPVILNLAIIGGTLVLADYCSLPVYGAALGVTIGGALQLTMQVIEFYYCGYRLRLYIDWRNPGLLRMVRLIIPTLFGVAIYQINIMTTDFIGSFYDDIRLNWLYFANRIFQLPLGLFSVAVATVVLPDLSRYASLGDKENMERTLTFSLRFTLLLVIPTTFALLFLSSPLVNIIFYSGKVTIDDCAAISDALVGYGGGLIGVSLTGILARAFYAVKDTRTPVIASLYSFLANIVFSILMVGSLKTYGLALSTSIAAGVNAIALYLMLRGKGISIRLNKLVEPTLKILLCSVVMIVIVVAIDRYCFSTVWKISGFTSAKLFAMVTLVGVGITLYFLGTFLLKIHDYKKLFRH